MSHISFIILFVRHRFCLPHTISLLLRFIYGTLSHFTIRLYTVRSFVLIDSGQQVLILFTRPYYEKTKWESVRFCFDLLI